MCTERPCAKMRKNVELDCVREGILCIQRRQHAHVNHSFHSSTWSGDCSSLSDNSKLLKQSMRWVFAESYLVVVGTDAVRHQVSPVLVISASIVGDNGNSWPRPGVWPCAVDALSSARLPRLAFEHGAGYWRIACSPFLASRTTSRLYCLWSWQ